MKEVYNTSLYWKCVIRQVNKFFLKLLDSHTTYIVKDIFVFPTESIQKNNPWSRKSADTAKACSNFEKKLQKINPRYIFRKVTKFYETLMNYEIVIKQNIPGGRSASPPPPVWLGLNSFHIVWHLRKTHLIFGKSF